MKLDVLHSQGHRAAFSPASGRISRKRKPLKTWFVCYWFHDCLNENPHFFTNSFTFPGHWGKIPLNCSVCSLTSPQRLKSSAQAPWLCQGSWFVGSFSMVFSLCPYINLSYSLLICVSSVCAGAAIEVSHSWEHLHHRNQQWRDGEWLIMYTGKVSASIDAELSYNPWKCLRLCVLFSPQTSSNYLAPRFLPLFLWRLK